MQRISNISSKKSFSKSKYTNIPLKTRGSEASARALCARKKENDWK